MSRFDEEQSSIMLLSWLTFCCNIRQNYFSRILQFTEDLKFAAYVEQIDKTPFFHLVKHDLVKQSFYSKDYNKLFDQIASLYEGISASDVDKIKADTVNLAKSVFGQKRSEAWNNLFSQSTVDMDKASGPSLFIYYTSLHMLHKQGKSEVSEQDYEVRRTEYIVLPDMIKAYADMLQRLDKQSVEDWLSDATSPQKKDVKLCFDVKP